jgi:membrane protein DedA with SNARE-associated domain
MQAAYLGLGLIVAVECVGVPLPGETALIAAGALARRGQLALPAVIAVAAVAAIAGDSLGYLVGRNGGRRLLTGAGPLRRIGRVLHARGEPFFERHGAKAVFLARWVAWARMATPVLAGAGAMPYRRFVRWNVLGGCLWAASIGTLAYALGSVAGHLAADVSIISVVVAGGALAVAVGHRLRKRPWSVPARAFPTASFAGPVALCVLLAVVLRAPFLGTPLGVDEGGLAFVAEHWRSHGASLYGDQWLDRPPLLLLTIRLAVEAGGAAGVRVLGALAAGALVVVTAALARAIGGARAGRCAAAATAVLASSVALNAVYTPAELLAAVPSAASVLCLVVALRTGRSRHLLVAGVFATSAALVKQSFLDAGLAGVVFLLGGGRHMPVGRGRQALLVWTAGAALPVLAVAVAGRGGYLRAGDLPYALLGFRLDALRTLAGGPLTFALAMGRLLLVAGASGLAFAAGVAATRVRRLRSDPVVARTLAAWLIGGLAGVGAGGSYWPHYLIELVPAVAVVFALAVADMSPAVRRAAFGAAIAVAVATALGATAFVVASHPHRAERDVGRYIRAHARPGDTQYVLYARANVLYYGGLRTPFPYDWSLMMRARPGAREALYGLLASPRRPTWLVTWQDDDRWRLDRGGTVDALLGRYYRPAAVVDGHRVLRSTAVSPS